MSYITVLDTIATKLQSVSALTTLLTGGIYTDRQVLQGNNQPRNVAGQIAPFLVLTQPTEGDLPNNIPGRFYLYYFDCYLYDDKSRPFNTLKQAASLIYAALNLTTLPANDEASDAGGGSIVRRPSPGQGEETAFTANRLIEYYRITISRK